MCGRTIFFIQMILDGIGVLIRLQFEILNFWSLYVKYFCWCNVIHPSCWFVLMTFLSFCNIYVQLYYNKYFIIVHSCHHLFMPHLYSIMHWMFYHGLASNVQHLHEIIFIASHHLVVVLVLFFDILIINKLR